MARAAVTWSAVRQLLLSNPVHCSAAGSQLQARGRGMHRFIVPQDRRVHVGAVVGGVAAQYAVVVVGEALRFHECLLASGGTAVEIRIARGCAVVSLHDLLGYRGHKMGGAITPIGPFL